MFNQEPCFGVNTNLNRPFGIVSKNRCVSLDVCAEWLSRMILMVSCNGYFLSSIFKNSIKSELLCVSLTNGMASPVRRSIPANKESVPRRLYSASRYTSPFSVVGRQSGAVVESACMPGFSSYDTVIVSL